MLVRPRVISQVSLYPYTPDHNPSPTNFDAWWKGVREQYLYHNANQTTQLIKSFGVTPDELFSSLRLGDTQTNLEQSYVAKVTSFTVFYKGTHCFVDTLEKGRLFEERIRRERGSHARATIVAVGLEFYLGMEKTETGLTAISPWGITHKAPMVWFYNTHHVIPIENIIRFEQVQTGDLVLFAQSSGLVIEIHRFDKPKWYKTSSWTNRTVKLLSGMSFRRFLPDRQFSVKSRMSEDVW